MSSAVSQALTLNSSLNTAKPDGMPQSEEVGPSTALTGQDSSAVETELVSSTEGPEQSAKTSALDIAALNQTIVENHIDPDVVLNEDLVTVYASSEALGLAQTLSEDTRVSTLSVGQDANSTDGYVNFYILLDSSEDQKIVCVNDVELSYSGGNRNKYYYCTKTDVYHSYLQTPSLISSVTTNNLDSGYYLLYTTSMPSGKDSFNTTLSLSNNNNERYTFGQNGDSNTYYAILTTRSGNWWNGYTYTPVQFWTVTLDYSAVTSASDNKVQYVQNGVASTLTPSTDYTWYDEDGDLVTSLPESITGTTTLYAKPNNVTVTYYDLDGNIIDENTTTHKRGDTHTVKDTLENCVWYDSSSGTAYTSGQTFTVSSNTTLEARRLYTITYYGTNSTIIKSLQVMAGTDYGVEPPDTGYYWSGSDGVKYYTNSSFTVNADMSLVKTPITCVVTITDASGKTTTQEVPYGQEITLGALPGNDYKWYCGSDAYDAGAKITVTTDMNFIAAATVTLMYVDENGDITAATSYPYNTVVDVADPGDGYVWVDNGGNQYQYGDSITLTQNTTLTARRVLTVNYDLNFELIKYNNTDISVDTTPTIVGGGGTDTVTVPESIATLRIHNVTPREVAGTLPGYDSNGKVLEERVYYFVGWRVEDSDVIIEPGTNLTGAELVSYAGDDGVLNLTGVWESESYQTVVFFVAYSSKEGELDEASEYYTGVVFSTHVGGGTSSVSQNNADHQIGPATTMETYYEVDQQIRALHGERSAGVWLYDFPDDDYIFEQLKSYAEGQLLEVEDEHGNTETVKAEDLNSNEYAIRWYVFKSQNNSWHIDGRLVKKVGVIHVEKTFAGEAELVEAGKNDFCIIAAHDDRSVLLTLGDGYDVNAPDGTTETVTPYSVSDDGLTYVWHIEDVSYNEEWTITEHREAPDKTSVYTEHSVYDSKGTQSAISRYGTEVSVTGVTYAPDEGDDHILRAEFRNFYLSSDSLAIKKEDGKSGQPIGGAEFELWQELTSSDGSTDLVQLKFSYNADGKLVFDQTGSITTISTGSTGYSEIVIEGFSFEAGPVYVREVGAPGGYTPAPEIVLRQVEGGGENDAEIASVGGAAYETDEYGEHMYAEYYPDEKVLVVKNYSQKTTTITAQKTWASPEATWADTVTVELYANGVLASSLVPTIDPVVELEKENGYTYTWEEMPLYINGQTVMWTLKEIKVGNEERTSADSFVNWIDTYNRYETRDRDGDLTALTLEVENDTRRTLLYVEKTDSTGLTVLAGAEFKLEQVTVSNGTFVTLDGGHSSTAVTATNGRLLFDNLSAGYYRLTEVSPPDGYKGLEEPVYLHVVASGKIKQVGIQDGAVVTLADGVFENGLSRPYDFVIRVPNQAIGVSLPATGGNGTDGYTLSGGLLIAAAVLLMIYRKSRRKEDSPYV